jgi:hypothetical protein
MDSVKRKQYVQFIIDYYVSKNHLKLESVGFLSGYKNTETYGMSNVPFAEGKKVRDKIQE